MPSVLDDEQFQILLDQLKLPELTSLPFSLGRLQQLTLGCSDQAPRLTDARGNDSDGLLSANELEALAEAAADRRLPNCRSLVLRGVLAARPTMSPREPSRGDSDALLRLLRAMPQLVELDLSGNLLGYAHSCVDALPDIFLQLEHLTMLNLSANGFFSFKGGDGAVAPHVRLLLRALRHLSKLEVLDLHLNDKAFIRDMSKMAQGLASDVAALTTLPCLKRLIFFENYVNLDFVRRMEAERPEGVEVDYGLKSFVAEAFEAAHCASTPTGGGIFRPPLFDVRDALRAPVVLPAFFYKLAAELRSSGPLPGVTRLNFRSANCRTAWPGLIELLPFFPNATELNLSGAERGEALKMLKALSENKEKLGLPVIRTSAPEITEVVPRAFDDL
ncbi:Uncharacterized protein SCF082_LOCUS51729 [Durusdinium trenchii]|uniref:Uncharacterized protein n=1 Tax=Durusdinium trenchii TaxID=1381693 RepID=A0ABP0SGC6_9DINO